MKGRSIAFALLGSLVVLTAQSGLVPSAGLAKTAPPEVAGVTRIAGDKTSAMWVTIPREVRFQSGYGPNPDIQIRGAGRMVGFVLTQVPTDRFDREFVFGGRAAFCSTPGCESDDTYQFMGATSASGSDPANSVVLPPGRYVLYLLADGAPASVTLRLHGLDGRTQLRPDAPVDAGVSVPTAETEVVAPEKKAYWFGDSATIDSNAGLFLGALSIDTQRWVEGVYGSCLQRELHGLRPVAFSPACPGGTQTRSVEGYPLSPIDRKLHHSSVWNVVPGGSWGLGMNFVGAADVQHVTAMTFHMAYDIPTL